MFAEFLLKASPKVSVISFGFCFCTTVEIGIKVLMACSLSFSRYLSYHIPSFLYLCFIVKT